MLDFIAIDLETTGFSPLTSDILEIGAWKIKNGVVVDKFNSLVKPIGYISRNIQELTGITDSMVKDCEPLATVLVEFFDWCERLPFLGHNLKFDYDFLLYKGKFVGLDFSLNGSRCGIDTLKLCKSLLNLQSNKLEDVAKSLQVSLSTDNKENRFHRASYDAYVTKLIYDRFLLSHSNISSVILPESLCTTDSNYGKAVIKDVLEF